MSSTRLAFLALALWCLAFMTITAVFFLGGGPASFAADSTRIALGAVAYAFGLLGQGWLLMRARRPSGSRTPVRDERDEAIERAASVITVTVILMVTYTFSLGLWVVYQSAGSVPTGWLWYLAHAVVALGAIIHSTSQLVVARRMGGHA